MERVGLGVLRRNMREFIKADYRDLILERPVKMKTPAGSWIQGEPELIGPQRFRLIPDKRRPSKPEIDNQEGSIPYQGWSMIGYWDADIQKDDEFELNGDRYKVVSITPDTSQRQFTDRVTALLELRAS